jgi:putative ABC transport system permease protein
VDLLLQDLKYAGRLFIRNPGFTLIAVLTLALGIGATAAVFSVIDAVLLRRLPYRQPERLVAVWNTYYPAWPKIGLSGADFHDWRPQVRTLSDMAGFRFLTRSLNVTGDGDPERVDVTYATANLFSTLGIAPVLGRALLAEEDGPGSAPVALISHRLWQRHFGGSAAAVGRTIALDGAPCTIVGVLPPTFQLLPDADLWLSAGQMTADERTGRVRHPFAVVARLAPGVTPAEAQAELTGLAQRAAAAFPATNKNFGLLVEPLRDPDAVRLERGLLIVFAVVACVLLVACANFTNLLLARNTARQKEIAVRTAMGASRGRIISQLVTESVVIALAAGLAGLIFATAGQIITVAFLPSTALAVTPEPGLSLRVLAFTGGLALAVGGLCALAAIRPFRTDVYRVLKDEGRGVAGSGGQRWPGLIVVAEIALAVTPLIAAGLLVRGFDRLLAIDPGFRTDHVLTLKVSRPATPGYVFREYTLEQRQDYLRKVSGEFEAAAETIRQLPGVKRVGGSDGLPLHASLTNAARFVIEGEVLAQREPRSAQVFNVSVDYFAAIGIALIEGRLFDRNDWALDRIIINSAMARQFWPGGSPIGKRVNLCSLDRACWATVIGVVGDVHQFGLDGPSTFDVYYPGWKWTDYVIVHTAAEPATLAPAIRAVLHAALPALPITHVASGEELVADAVSPLRFAAILLTALALLTLALAAVGIYGVMSYVVERRTQEFGIRMALGARRQNLLASIMGRGARLVVAGILIGWIGAFATMKALSGILYQVDATDGVTFAVVAALLAIVGLAACGIPAYRVTRMNPTRALHEPY